jgi:hypothetical protein
MRRMLSRAEMVKIPLRNLLLDTGGGAEYEDYSMLRISPLMFLEVMLSRWTGDFIGYAFFLNDMFWKIQEINSSRPVYSLMPDTHIVSDPFGDIVKPDNTRLIRVGEYGKMSGLYPLRAGVKQVDFKETIYNIDRSDPLTIYESKASGVYLCNETNLMMCDKP